MLIGDVLLKTNLRGLGCNLLRSKDADLGFPASVFCSINGNCLISNFHNRRSSSIRMEPGCMNQVSQSSIVYNYTLYTCHFIHGFPVLHMAIYITTENKIYIYLSCTQDQIVERIHGTHGLHSNSDCVKLCRWSHVLLPNNRMPVT